MEEKLLSSHTKAWKVLLVATGVNFLAGLLYIWSVLSKGLMNELQWTSTQASLPYTVATVSFVIAMAMFGKMQDTRGPRICATIGGILIGIGLVLSGLTKDPLVMALTFGIITGAGVGMAATSTTPPAIKWFPLEKRGMITGIVFAGVAFAAMVYAPLINYLLSEFGISYSFIILGIGTGALMIILAQFLINPPAGYLPRLVDSSDIPISSTNTIGKDYNRKDLLKSLDFYKLWIMLAFSSSTGLMIFGHATNIAKVQASWEGGYLLVILLALFNVIGRLLGGTVSDKIGRFNVMRVMFLIQALNMLLFSTYQSIPLLSLGIAIAGICYGGSFTVFSATTADFYGMKYFGANYGMLFTAWGVGGVIGPMTAASILDATYSYNSAYIVACALLVIAFVIAFTIKKPLHS